MVRTMLRCLLMALSFSQVFMENNDNSTALSPQHPLDVKFTTIAAKFNTVYSNTTSINSGYIYEYKFNHSTVSCLTISVYVMSAYIVVGEITKLVGCLVTMSLSNSNDEVQHCLLRFFK